MKKSQVEHVLRAAGEIVGDKQFIVIGSQAIHAKYPDRLRCAQVSAEVDLIAKNHPDRTELLNEIGVDSRFHETHGYYADPVDAKSAVLPRGWKGRLVNLRSAATNGVTGLCLDPHDLVISKYVARREKDLAFNREAIREGLVQRDRLLELVDATPVDDAARRRIRRDIDSDFKLQTRDG